MAVKITNVKVRGRMEGDKFIGDCYFSITTEPGDTEEDVNAAKAAFWRKLCSIYKARGAKRMRMVGPIRKLEGQDE